MNAAGIVNRGEEVGRFGNTVQPEVIAKPEYHMQLGDRLVDIEPVERGSAQACLSGRTGWMWRKSGTPRTRSAVSVSFGVIKHEVVDDAYMLPLRDRLKMGRAVRRRHEFVRGEEGGDI
jgi:hypothetical protein